MFSPSVPAASSAPSADSSSPEAHAPTSVIPDFPSQDDCRECESPLNAEHFAVVPCKDKSDEHITYAYCAHCNVGYQSLWVKKPWSWRWRLDSCIRYDGETIPAFLKILEAQLCVRA